jgi:hippurate hydrolase
MKDSLVVDDGLVQEAGTHLEEAVTVRRRIHSHPECGLDLPVTQQLVLEQLSDMGLPAETGGGCSSVVAQIAGDQNGPVTLLRADMDALEMPEDTGIECSSKIDGKMHACGHDAHVAMLLGATRVLMDHRKDLRGRIVLMFQPGEEGHDGAKVMLEEGLLTKHGPVDRAFAMHISSRLPSGWLACRPGTMLASADEFEIVVTGAGGHASMPHDTTDPVPVACEMVTALNSMITRVIPVFDPAVLTVSSIRAGTALNVIPETAVLGGTIRAVSDHSRDKVLEHMHRVVDHVAQAHGCRAEVRMLPHNYPVTVNHPGFAGHTLDTAKRLIPEDRVLELPSPAMGAEDWSYVLQAVPGSMAFLGAAPPGVRRVAPNHSNRFIIDETAMATGIAMYAAMALS